MNQWNPSKIYRGLVTNDFHVNVTETQVKSFAKAVEWPLDHGLPPTLPITFWQHSYPEWLKNCPLPQLLKEQNFIYEKPLRIGISYRCRIECAEAYYVQTPKNKVYLALLHRLIGEEGDERVFIADTLLYLPVSEPIATEVIREPVYELASQGMKLQSSLIKRITTEAIREYAYASGDTQAIHLEEAAAQAAGFPAVLAHGMYGMGLSISSETVLTDKRLVSYHMRFLAPIFAGDQVQFSIYSGEDKASNGQSEQSFKLVGCSSRTGKPVYVGKIKVT
ncbi:MaoC/PaaZ C-terminal domain-containing protein [Brevibacillus ginsengisoli]|uniref:MaoC family dehydratase n=1 Tax=Brevibacillus ginsengisoli TaxID=363854 RepID=UPI003CFACA64